MKVLYEPRVLPLSDIRATYGHGWMESKWPPEEGDDGAEEMVKCVWLYGDVLTYDRDIDYTDHYVSEDFARAYNRLTGGWRIWDMQPTEEQRRRTPWR